MLRFIRKIYSWSLAGFLVLLLLYLLLTKTKDPPKETIIYQNTQQYYVQYRYEARRNTLGNTTTRLCHFTAKPSYNNKSAVMRYVLGLNYWEQTNMALGNMFALDSFIKYWSAQLVQPFIYNSRLYGIPHFLSDHHWVHDNNISMLSLKDIFSIKELNKLKAAFRLPKLVHFCHFLQNAKRQITIIHFISHRESREPSVLKSNDRNILLKRLANEHVFECSEYSAIQKINQRILYSLNYELLMSSGKIGNEFKLFKHFCVNTSIETTPALLAEKCSFSRHDNNLTLLILNWRGLGEKHNVIQSAKGIHKSKRLMVKNVTLYQHPRGGTHIFQHSLEVRKATKSFMSSLGLFPQNFIGVHIRSEKLGQRDKRIKGFLDKCITKVLKLVELFKHRYRQYSITYLTDFGPGGSDSCFACKGARKLKYILKRNNITTVRFNAKEMKNELKPNDHHKHSGFIAAVEMELLASSSILVLVGGGAYERQTALHKINNSRMKDGIVRVCWDDEGIMLPDLISGVKNW